MISPEDNMTLHGRHHERERKTLSQTKAGQTVRLTSIKGGQSLRSRLAAMGLVKGVELKVLSGGSSGPCILAIKHSRIVLGRTASHKVEVE
ncbi:MAG: FeoA family protein [Lentisphaerota bacterium]